MIEHIIFFIAVIGFALGLSNLIILILIFLKYKYRLLIIYFFVLLALSLIFFTDIIDFYLNIFEKSYLFLLSPVTSITLIFSYISYAALIYLLPYLIHRFLGHTFVKVKRILFLTLAGIFPIGIIIFFLTQFNLLSYIADFLFFGVLLYSVIVVRSNLLKIKIIQLQRFVRVLYIVIIYYFPVFIIDSFILDFIPQIPLWFKMIPLFFILFYISWNSLNLIYAAQFFFKPVITDFIYISNSFNENFSITEREKEIIKGIISSQSNKEIAYNLRISEKTVKNHIYNIFQKTRVQNRVELIMKIHSFSN